MDIEFIKEKIYHLNDDSKKIQPGEYLSAEVISILRDGQISDRAACFAPIKNSNLSKNDVCLFTSEITCSECKKEIVEKISKQRLLDYLRGLKPILCEDCKKIFDEQKKVKQSKLSQSEKQRINTNTENYIKNYLNPKEKWDSHISSYERQRIIIKKYDINNDMIARHVQNMDYKDFLQTPYWDTISAYKKYKENYKCALCGKNKDLEVHHKSYTRHGYEHNYNVIEEDLIVLCKDCHGKFHDKI